MSYSPSPENAPCRFIRTFPVKYQAGDTGRTQSFQITSLTRKAFLCCKLHSMNNYITRFVLFSDRDEGPCTYWTWQIIACPDHRGSRNCRRCDWSVPILPARTSPPIINLNNSAYVGSPSGLRLYLTLDSPFIKNGSNIVVRVYENNTLDRPNNV